MILIRNISLLMLVISSYASASWNCTATCRGSETKILSSIACGFTPAQHSDFVANCRQVLGGTVSGSSCTYCGSYEVCQKSEASTSTVSGSGADLMSARQDARKSCEGQNQSGSSGGNGCPFDYKSYHLEESSLNCSQSLRSGSAAPNFPGRSGTVGTRLTCNLINSHGQRESIVYDSKLNQALYLTQVASVELKNCRKPIGPIKGAVTTVCEGASNGGLGWQTTLQKANYKGQEVVYAWLNRIDRVSPNQMRTSPIYTKFLCR